MRSFFVNMILWMDGRAGLIYLDIASLGARSPSLRRNQEEAEQ